MKVMMLGGGTNQLCAIKRIMERGDEVVVTDYLEDSPGKKIATYTDMADTFSYEDSLDKALKHKVDAVLTVGTDQPVLTAARIAEEMGLPSGISAQTAEAVTNKKIMKRIFEDHGIPNMAYEIINNSSSADLSGCADFFSSSADFYKNMTYPAVLKPVDSQGQRGIFKVYSANEVLEKLPATLSFSKTGEAVLESYYENQEVTVSGWVSGGKTYILTMTDRVTFSDENKIGVCVSHEHPSAHIKNYGQKARKMTEDIVKAFGIENGPIYFQFLIGREGMVANEIACRIGGAYEDQFIPEITGFSILDAQLDLAQGRQVDVSILEGYDFEKNDRCVSVQLFFASPGVVSRVSAKEDMVKVDGLSDFRCHYGPGAVIPETQNASARAGFALIYGASEQEIKERIDLFYDALEIRDVDNRNLVIRGTRGNR